MLAVRGGAGNGSVTKSTRSRRSGQSVGVTADPFARWLALRAERGDDVGLLTLYTLAGERQGLAPEQLPRDERHALARRALPVLYPGAQLVEGSERGDPLTVVPYDPSWPAAFLTWRRRIADVLGAAALSVEHVGSTSVPGLPAKPVIDVQVTVPDFDDEPAYVPALASVGLQLRSRDLQHRYLRPFPGRPRTVHVHVSTPGSAWERDHLLFRDYLRTHDDARDAYGRLKLHLVEVWHDDRMGYTEAKGDLIRSILDAGRQWAATTGWTR